MGNVNIEYHVKRQKGNDFLCVKCNFFLLLKAGCKNSKNPSFRRVTTGGIKKGRKRNNAIESDHCII